MKNIEIKRGTVAEIEAELIEDGVPFIVVEGETTEAGVRQRIGPRLGRATVLIDCNDPEVIAGGLSANLLHTLSRVAALDVADVAFVVHEAPPPTSFQLVSDMNEAFGNPKGNPAKIDWPRVLKQCLNIPDEFGELAIALGCEPEKIKAAVAALKEACVPVADTVDEEGVRDALCDIQVFDMGAQHFMGVDGDEDMRSVVDGVMTRFIKDDADKEATIAMHAAKGVVNVYFEGDYPTMVMKSASDQPDAPKGKFLKSASFVQTKFRPLIGK